MMNKERGTARRSQTPGAYSSNAPATPQGTGGNKTTPQKPTTPEEQDAAMKRGARAASGGASSGGGSSSNGSSSYHHNYPSSLMGTGDASTIATPSSDTSTILSSLHDSRNASTAATSRMRSRHSRPNDDDRGISDDSDDDEQEYIQPGAFAFVPGERPLPRQNKGQLTHINMQANPYTPEYMPDPVFETVDESAVAQQQQRLSADNGGANNPLRASPFSLNQNIAGAAPSTKALVVDNEKNNKKRRCMIIMIVVAILVIAVGAGVGVAVSGGGDDKKDAGLSQASPSPAPTADPLLDELMDRLSKFTTDQSVWEDPESPQVKALYWLVQEDLEWQQEEDVTLQYQRLETRYALAVLYYSTTSTTTSNWFDRLGFMDPSKHECLWNKYYSSDVDSEDNVLEPLDLLSNLPQLACGVILDFDPRVGPDRDDPADDGYGIVCRGYDYGTAIDAAVARDNGVSTSNNETSSSSSGPTVVAILLERNSLVGTVPEELIILQDLEVLDLSWNELSGPGIPPSTISYSSGGEAETLLLWPNIRDLDLTKNQFDGTILLEDYSHWTKLENFRLGENSFRLALPSGETPWSQWSQLKLMDMHINEITGTLPTTMGLMNQLSCLDLRMNSITGSLPAQFVQSNDFPFFDLAGLAPVDTPMPSLWYFGISRNMLMGTLPTFTSTSLARFEGDENSFSGVLPIPPLAQFMNTSDTITTTSESAKVMPLEWLLLSQNNLLTGTIPFADMAYLGLKNVGMSFNQLSGTIGSEIGNIQPNLATLYLAENRLIGTIPSSIGNLTKMQRLLLSGNLLTGAIPSEIGLMNDLQRLHLNNNFLTGTIPSDLANVPNLVSLRFETNDLTGDLSDLCSRRETVGGPIRILSADCVSEVLCDCCTSCF